MLHAFLILTLTLAGATAALAQTLPSVPRAAVCRNGLQHVSLLRSNQMCPRPLATTVIARPRHGVLHT